MDPVAGATPTGNSGSGSAEPKTYQEVLKYTFYVIFAAGFIALLYFTATGQLGNRTAASKDSVKSQGSTQDQILNTVIATQAIKGNTTTALALTAAKKTTQGFQDMGSSSGGGTGSSSGGGTGSSSGGGTGSTPSEQDQAQQNEAPTADEDSLVNYSPLTILQPGFMGPAEDGVYDEVKGVTMALDRGARCFVLPIDYHELPTFDASLYAPRGYPCMLYRDAGGVLRSMNSGSINKVAQTLANYGFSDATNFRNDPMIVILYFVRTPDKDADTARYLEYLSAVAKALSPLIPYHLGQSPEGAFTRQNRQSELLYMPIAQFNKKVLIFTNADTTPFRRTDSLKIPRYAAKDDLDYLTHMRIYKNSTADMGVTPQTSDRQLAYSIVENLSYFTSIPPDRVTQTTDKTKIQFTIALPQVSGDPTAGTRMDALTGGGAAALTVGLGSLLYGVIPSASKANTSPFVIAALFGLAGAAVGTGAVFIGRSLRTPDTNGLPSLADSKTVLDTIGIQCLPINLGLLTESNAEVLGLWKQNWRIKPKALRFVRPAPIIPATPSTAMDGNQGQLSIPGTSRNG